MYLKGACGQSHAIVCIFEVDLVTIDENVTVRAHMPFFFSKKLLTEFLATFCSTTRLPSLFNPSLNHGQAFLSE